MKVLHLKPGEVLRIGDTIAVEVRRIRGRSCQLSIHAPREIRIDREEVRARREADRGAGVMKQKEIFR